MSATQTKEKQPCCLQLFSFPADCLAICLSHTGLAHILTLYVFLPNSLLHSEFVVMSHLLWLMSISCQSLNTLWHWACGLQACSLNHLRAYFFYSNNRYSNIKVDIYLWFLKTFFHSDTNRKPIFLKLSYFTSIRAFLMITNLNCSLGLKKRLQHLWCLTAIPRSILSSFRVKRESNSY